MVKLSAAKVLENLPVVPTGAKRWPKPKTKIAEQAPKVRVEGSIDTSDHEVIHIKVRKQIINGREFYVDAEGALYDMKFNPTII